MDRRTVFAMLGAAALLGTLLPTAIAAGPKTKDRAVRPLPDVVSELRLETSVTRARDYGSLKLERALQGATGPQDVVIRLKTAPTARIKGAAGQRAQATKVKTQQQGFEARAKKIDRSFTVLARTTVSLNAVVARVNGKQLAKLATDPSVASIRKVRDYQLDLSETVPYIGGTAVQGLGVTGEGITVAVLDSGIDYTHKDLGGPGTLLAYKNAYGVKTKDTKNTKINDAYKGKKLFPTAKVIGGYDFVGESWPDGALAPDPDPIDCGGPVVIGGCDGGHGTHVADIIAGTLGVAPDATLLAIKVCSAVATSCSGIALLQGMDFALDPNQDGVTTDHADVINMSLGSDYGQPGDDDLVAAVESATAAGVLTVASAGNGSDKPYIAGTPASAPTALSVAQTSVPSDEGFAMRIDAPAAIAGNYEAVFQPWSTPLTSVISGGVQYGDGIGGNLDGCAAFPAGSLAGKIVFVDRGACNFTLKISNIGVAGGKLGIIGMIAPGDPFTGGDGGDRPLDIPGYMVSQSVGNRFRANIATIQVTFDPANSIPLVGVMVGSSSRGPSMDINQIKPEIGAPGASISAEVGTATERTGFGGTSGAAPMVSGSAALLRSAFPGRTPLEIKAVLINTAETDILNKPELFGGAIAPITRIGGGEVRVDRAYASKAAAWDKNAPSAALSFGFHDITEATTTLTRTVVVKNYSSSSITYGITPDFRFAGDAASGAIDISAPATVTVPASGTAEFVVTMTIHADALPGWGMDSGGNGASAARLTAAEFDGYVWLDDQSTAADDADPLHLPWQVLPRPAADVALSAPTVAGNSAIDIANPSANDAFVEAYSLIATSPDDPDSGPGDALADVDLRALGVQTFPVPAGFCSADASFVLALAVNTWDRQTHAVAPAFFEWDLDTNGDGAVDYAVYNADASGLGNVSDGRNLVNVLDVAAETETAFFFTDHRTNSANTVLYLCGEQIGMNAADFFTPITATVYAVDYYQSGTERDVVEDIAFSPLGERYLGYVDGSPAGGPVGAGDSAELYVQDFGPAGTNPGETGLLLRVIDGPEDNEAILLPVD
ncbi:MAG: S8 family serine peptidase [Candidatus Limnocylindrales bacterium]